MAIFQASDAIEMALEIETRGEAFYRAVAKKAQTPEIKALAKPPLDLSRIPFDPLEYIEHLDELPFDPDLDPGLGQ